MANTKASLTQQNTQTYPSNTSGSITALAVKSFNNNFINAVATLGDTNVFTQPQTFGDVVQVNSNVIANNFVGPLIGTASWAVNALTASNSSTAASSSFAVSASYALSASHAQTSVTASHAVNADLLDGKDSSVFATTGSNTFNGTNTFTGSLNAQSASITFLTVDTIISSSTINNSGSNQLGDAANDTQTLWGTVNLPSGPLKVTGSVSSTGGFTGSLQGTSSWANNATNAISSSYALNAVTASFLLGAVANAVSASYASSSTSASYASNGFPFTGSAQISGALTITNNTDGVLLDFKQPSHTTESILSFRMGNQADVTQSISVGSNYLFSGSFNNTYRIVIPTTIDNATLTGSLFGTASYAAQALSASWAPGGGGGGMNLGANVFTGSQTLSSSTTPASLIMNVSGALPSFVTESNGALTGYGNIIFNQRTNAALSGSTIISGSGNIIFEGGLATTTARGVSGNNNIGLGILYTGSIPTSTGNIAQSAMASSGSRNTLSLNLALSQATLNNNNNVSASFSTNVVVAPVQVNTTFSSSVGLNASSTVQNGFFGTTLIDIVGSGSAARAFQNNLVGGNNNTASLTTPTGSINQSGSLYNTFVYGSNLIVSGTQITTQALHGGAFVGRYNETASIYPNTSSSLASSKDIVFGVGAGTSITARKTPFYVSASGLTVIGDNAFISGTLTVEQDTDTIAFQLTQKTVGAATWWIAQEGGANTSTNIATNATHIFRGGAATQYQFTVPTTVSSSFAVTGSTSLTGSLTVNGNLQYNFGEFWSSASVTPTAGVSQSVVFDSTGIASGVAISGSGALIKVTNAGTYNIQFSTQVNTSAGADTIWIWFKKNGANIASSNSKAVLANNTGQLITANILDSANANDYYEIAYQTNSGNAQILSEAASGNLPAIPGVILTVTQVK